MDTALWQPVLTSRKSQVNGADPNLQGRSVTSPLHCGLSYVGVSIGNRPDELGRWLAADAQSTQDTTGEPDPGHW